MYLALDRITGYSAPTGRIVGLNQTLPGLRAAGFAGTTYRGTRLVDVDESDSTAWDPNCTIGWFWQDGAVSQSLTANASDQLALDIAVFKGIFESVEASDFQQLLAREKVDTVLDSGHSWVDDMLHAWVKPWLRLLESTFVAQKALATPDKTAWTTHFQHFVAQAQSPGLLGFYSGADKSVWRSRRNGANAFRYNSVGGGIVGGSGTAVTYGADHTVATWNAYEAINNL